MSKRVIGLDIECCDPLLKTVEIEVPYNKGEEWHVCGEEYQEPDEIKE